MRQQHESYLCFLSQELKIEAIFDTICSENSSLTRKLELKKLVSELCLTNMQFNGHQRKVSEISHLLSDQASREEAISLIRSLIERIDITPGEKRGQPQVQLVGGLAAIL